MLYRLPRLEDTKVTLWVSRISEFSYRSSEVSRDPNSWSRAVP